MPQEPDHGLFTGDRMYDSSNNQEKHFLTGIKVLIGVTASISIYRVPDLIRDLKREGAEVKVVASGEALDLVGSKVFQWASDNDVVSEITGRIEHVTEFQDDPENVVYAVVPATHNFIGKASAGIADDPPSLFFSYACGNGNPIVLAPTMHGAMMYNPIMKRNLETLEATGSLIVPPRMEEGKAKIETNDTIVDYIIRSARGDILRGKTVMVIGGGTSEPVDPVRSVSNTSTGLTAYWIARNSFRMGAEKVIYVGNCTVQLPPYVHMVPARDTDQFEKNSLDSIRIYNPDIIFLPAALSDFRVLNHDKKKLDGETGHTIELKPRPKLVSRIRKASSAYLVSFKLTGSIKEDREKISRIRKLSDMVVVNEFSGDSLPFGEGRKAYHILSADGESDHVLTKEQLAEMIIENVALNLERKEIEGSGSTE